MIDDTAPSMSKGPIPGDPADPAPELPARGKAAPVNTDAPRDVPMRRAGGVSEVGVRTRVRRTGLSEADVNAIVRRVRKGEGFESAARAVQPGVSDEALAGWREAVVHQVNEIKPTDGFQGLPGPAPDEAFEPGRKKGLNATDIADARRLLRGGVPWEVVRADLCERIEPATVDVWRLDLEKPEAPMVPDGPQPLPLPETPPSPVLAERREARARVEATLGQYRAQVTAAREVQARADVSVVEEQVALVRDPASKEIGARIARLRKAKREAVETETSALEMERIAVAELRRLDAEIQATVAAEESSTDSMLRAILVSRRDSFRSVAGHKLREILGELLLDRQLHMGVAVSPSWQVLVKEFECFLSEQAVANEARALRTRLLEEARR